MDFLTLAREKKGFEFAQAFKDLVAEKVQARKEELKPQIAREMFGEEAQSLVEKKCDKKLKEEDDDEDDDDKDDDEEDDLKESTSGKSSVPVKELVKLGCQDLGRERNEHKFKAKCVDIHKFEDVMLKAGWKRTSGMATMKTYTGPGGTAQLHSGGAKCPTGLLIFRLK